MTNNWDNKIFLNFITRCPLVTPPPAFGGSWKNGPFFTFLKFFHFYPKVKENKHFFWKKKTQKNAQKIAIFSFSRRFFIFKFFIFYVTFQLEKIKKKIKKNIKKVTKQKKQNFYKFYEKLKKKQKIWLFLFCYFFAIF